MREGGRRHAEILRTLAEMIHSGVSTLELEEEALRLIKENGDKPAHLNYRPRGAKRPFPAALCISINDEIVHGIPNEEIKVIKEGDVVSIDLSVWHKNLITDSAITVLCGEASYEAQELLKATKLALEKGIAAAKPGNHVGDIGSAISQSVKESGFSLAEDLSGHGVGYEIHEDPYVPNDGLPGRGEELKPGLVIAIEPMVTAGRGGIKQMSDGYTIKTRDGSIAAHCEHTIAITEKGNIVLTKN